MGFFHLNSVSNKNMFIPIYSYMNNKIYFLLFFIILIACNNIYLFAQAPHLSGTIDISIKNRTLSCNLSYDQIPEGYEILLNQAFKNPSFSANNQKLKTKKKNNSAHYVDAVQYELPHGTNGKVQLAYHYRENQFSKEIPSDWKGNLAFNYNSVRASEQTAWYPIWYNDSEGVQITDVSYDIEVSCSDCKSIYLNGSPPKDGQNAKLSSKKPVPLLLFAGLFDFDVVNNIALVNSPLQEGEDAQVISYLEDVKSFYESKFQMRLEKDLTVLASEPTTGDNAWLFATYPTIAIIGYENWGMKGLFKDGYVDEVRISSLAHEVGHYYIGNVFQPRGPLFWVFLEGVTEYISLQANRHIFGDEFYRNFLLKYKSQVQGLPFLHLSDINQQDEISGLYRYAYVPLLLTAIETEIGKDMMWQWIQQLISYKDNAYTDYAFFKRSFIESGMSERQYTDIEAKFINGPKTGFHVNQSVFQK